jgi:hypothetical protein
VARGGDAVDRHRAGELDAFDVAENAAKALTLMPS